MSLFEHRVEFFEKVGGTSRPFSFGKPFTAFGENGFQFLTIDKDFQIIACLESYLVGAEVDQKEARPARCGRVDTVVQHPPSKGGRLSFLRTSNAAKHELELREFTLSEGDFFSNVFIVSLKKFC